MYLITETYTKSQNFPKEKLFGVTSRIRRSAVSIPSNIAEGCGKRPVKISLILGIVIGYLDSKFR